MTRVLRAAVAALVLAGCKPAAPGSGETAPPSATTPTTMPAAAAPTSPAVSANVASAAPGTSSASPTSALGPWSFDGDKADAPPAGFGFGRTGNGKEGRWIVQPAADAPSKPNVLVQVDADATDYRFPVAVVDASSYTDVTLSVACKPISGNVDQACGLVWRHRDANNYYLVRANALEDNVRLYHVTDGNRIQFASWSGKVASKAWHTLAVEARGDRFVVTFDGRQVLDARDATFGGAGRIGVWTKADSVTQFDDLHASAL